MELVFDETVKIKHCEAWRIVFCRQRFCSQIDLDFQEFENHRIDIELHNMLSISPSNDGNRIWTKQAQPVPFLSSTKVAAICCDEVLPKLIRGERDKDTSDDIESQSDREYDSDSDDNADWLNVHYERDCKIKKISKHEIEQIRCSLINNGLDAFTLFSIDLQRFKEILNMDNAAKFDDEVMALILDYFKRRVQMNWYNVIEAANQENKAIARVMESVLLKSGLFGDLRNGEAHIAMLDAMKKDKKAMTPMEVKYTRDLLHRAVSGNWIATQQLKPSSVQFP